MSNIKKVLLNTSLFRQIYIICLFVCNISCNVYIVAYGVLALLFIWGSFLVVYNQIKQNTMQKTRHGLWLIGLLAVTVLTTLVHFLDNFGFNAVMCFHVAICFFVFYSVHTEKHLNFQKELFNVAHVIIYLSTVLGAAGLILLVSGINFERVFVNFIIYENRFTGLFINPNQLGFANVAAIFCCDMMLRRKFIEASGCRRMSRIWVFTGLAVNGLSLLLSDSNGAMILMIAYAAFFIIFMMFGSESHFNLKQIIVRSAACLLAGIVLVSSVYLLRTVCQTGVAEILKSRQVTTIDKSGEERPVTFEHENTNVDSGRLVLWQQGLEMFKSHPVIGIGKGNIYDYGNKMFEKGVKFSDHYGDLAFILTDFHNGYLTILVCSGILGFIFFMVFGVRFYIRITANVLHDDGMQSSILPCLYSFLCAYLVYSVIEVTLLYNIMFSIVFFWQILGYTACFLTKYEPDHPVSTFSVFGKKFRKTLL